MSNCSSNPLSGSTVLLHNTQMILLRVGHTQTSGVAAVDHLSVTPPVPSRLLRVLLLFLHPTSLAKSVGREKPLVSSADGPVALILIKG